VAGDAEVNAEGGEPEVGKAGEATRIPEELKPVFDAYANRAAESAAKRAEDKVRKEFEERDRLAKMSEADRSKAETDKLRTELEVLRGERQYLTTQSKVQAAVARNGFVPPEIVDAVLRDAIESGGDVDADQVARLARDRFQSYMEASGVKTTTRTAPAVSRNGTPGGRSDPNDFSTMTQEQIVAHAHTLGGMKGAKYLADSQNFLMRGGVIVGS
jgi:hypothetical protein